jgi:hypothetical protein
MLLAVQRFIAPSLPVVFAWLSLVALGCASSGPSRATDAGASPDAQVRVDGGPSTPDAGPPDAGVVARCGDGLCTRGMEDCEGCAIDCGECPVCDMAPTCTGALAVPTSTEPLPGFDNDTGSEERTNYACGTDLGVAPSETTCADPQLRIRLRRMSIYRGNTDIPSNMYCVISAEDGVHSELLVTTPREVAGWRGTTDINVRPSEGLLWGQGDLYRSTANLTITYQCYLTSNVAGAMQILDDIADRAAAVAEHADGYGWVFGTASVLSTIIGSSLGASSDTLILDVQQTIDAGALLTMTNGRSWAIHKRRGNFLIHGASDLRLEVESWGCAEVRPTLP